MIGGRSAALAVVGVMLAPALVLAGPARPAAALHDGGSDLVDYSRPLGAPSSVVGGRSAQLYPDLGAAPGSLDGASAAERARLVGNTIPQDAGLAPDGTRARTVTLPHAPRTYEKGPGALTSGIGLLTVGLAGYDVTNTALRLFGVPEDMIGLSSLVAGFGPAVNPDPGYVPDFDFEGMPAGWTDVPVIPAEWGSAGVYEPTTIAVELIVEPQSMIPGDPWVMRGSAMTAPPAATSSWATYGRFRVVCQSGTGELLAISNGQMSIFGSSAGLVWERSSSTSSCANYGAGALFDHFEILTLEGSEPVARWYPPGHELRPEGVSSPERQWEVRYRCETAAGPVWGSEFSEGFFETDESYPPFPEASCAEGDLAEVELWEVVPGFPDLDVLLDTWVKSDVVRDWSNGPVGELELHRVGVDGSPDLSCLDNPELCLDWWVDPDRATKYRCTYAGAPVDIRECAVYAPTPNALAGRDLLTEEGTKVPFGTYYPHADPATGLHVPGDGEPGAEPGADPAPDTQSDECPPPFTGLSLFNPWWYYKATVCALEFAFVPPAARLQAELDKTQQVIDAKGPGQWVDAIGVQVDAIGTWENAPGDCLGPNIEWATWGHDFDMYVFEACDPPRSTVAGHVQFWISVIVWFAALLGTLWIVASAFNIHMPWDGSEAD